MTCDLHPRYGCLLNEWCLVGGPEAVGVEVAEPRPPTGEGEGDNEAGLAPQLIRAVPKRVMAYGIP